MDPGFLVCALVLCFSLVYTVPVRANYSSTANDTGMTSNAFEGGGSGSSGTVNTKTTHQSSSVGLGGGGLTSATGKQNHTQFLPTLFNNGQLKIPRIVAAPDEVDRQQQDVTVKMAVTNTGDTPVDVNQLTLDFNHETDGDVSDEYTVSITDSIAQVDPHKTDTAVFSVDVAATATLGVVEIDGSVQGVDAHSGDDASIYRAESTDTWTVVNNIPVVDLLQPDTGDLVSGSNVPGTYVLTDPDDDPGTVTVEVSDDSGITWDTKATISGEISSVSSSDTGDTHTFSWDSLMDLGTVDDTDVKLRIKAYDGFDTGDWDTSPAFTVDNLVPKAETISSTADIAVPDTGVSVHWSPGTTDVKYYSIYRSKGTADTSGAVKIDTAAVRYDTTVYFDRDVTQGDSYFYYVTTVDTAGNESDSSNVTSAPYVAIWKTTLTDSPHRPGDTVEYTIAYLNEGFAPAGKVALYDAIPDSMTLTDTTTVIDTPTGITAIDIEYKRNGTWETSSFPRESVTQVRCIIPGAAASEESVQPGHPDTTNYSGRVQFFTEVD